ncbi:Protein of unknown function (DUF2851) [Cyclonatronum proteinivorum]|uniref:DUF2851 family protein n=1 Tax=Cyclonatronum proteinivorum TaxID=1457365 RepID=A0A345UNI3_9BACT|nr:DUF2851 family protein [Cyclonatronum proteinivorum]AXJ02035.1 Protein of unknown function (DUF2851) [Cyclonatronum proteinivorum]
MKEYRFQQLWKALAFGRQGHHTLCGQAFRIEDPGTYNAGDGPDFRMGALRFADGTLLRGDIELHLHEQQWQAHGHSTDPAYNGVILHVFLHPAAKPVRLQSGVQPLRCSLLPAITPGQFAGLQQDEVLPCETAIRYIRPEVVHAQLEKARQDYFENRANALIQWWDPALTIEAAWKKMVLRASASVLGLSRNREAMVKLAETIPCTLPPETSEAYLTAWLLARSGLHGQQAEPDSLKRTDWDLSGSRPGNKPEQRIAQLAALALRLHRLGRADMLKGPAVCAAMVFRGLPAGRRTHLLELIVWLPAFYLLGTQLMAEGLKQQALELWRSHQYQPEAMFTEAFRAAGFAQKATLSHLGIVHQQREWCAPKRCGNCAIGQSAGLSSA